MTFATVLAWALKHWQAIGLAALIAFAGLQSARLGHAKHDLAVARAALVNPKTHKTWQTEAKAAASNLETCRANTATLSGQIAAQNAAVAALKVESDRRLSAASKAASDARAVAESARQASAAIMARDLVGATACDRAKEVDESFLGALK